MVGKLSRTVSAGVQNRIQFALSNPLDPAKAVIRRFPDLVIRQVNLSLLLSTRRSVQETNEDKIIHGADTVLFGRIEHKKGIWTSDPLIGEYRSGCARSWRIRAH